MKVLVIICARNEEIHIRRSIAQYTDCGMEVILIDHQSTDGTRAIASEFLDKGLLSIETMPWKNEFSMSDQLRAKQKVIAASHHDWIVSADADEWLCSPVPGQSLLEGLIEADAQGYNCVNFHEIVFVPLPGEDFYRDDYFKHMANYYFFQPHYPRLNRAWKRKAQLSNIEMGGHLLVGKEVKRSPTDFILRHYIVLSEAHAHNKYVGLVASNEDRAKQWHGSRLNRTQENLRLKTSPSIFHMNDPARHDKFNFSKPVKTHFWEW